MSTPAPVPIVGRVVHLVVALCALAGVGTSWWMATTLFAPLFGFPGGAALALLDQLKFFTFMSNLLVGITSLELALRRDWTRAMHWLRLTATICIVITGVVFNLLLDTGGHVGIWAFNNAMVHVITPIVAPIAWLLVGPATTTPRRILWAMIPPILWLVATLVRGPYVGWYPYDFLDVALHGYAGVAPMIVAILAFFLGLGSAMWAVDAWRRRRSAPQVTDDSPLPELP